MLPASLLQWGGYPYVTGKCCSYGRSGRVVSASDCGVRGPGFASRGGRLCLSRQPLRYTALGTGCALLLQLTYWVIITMAMVDVRYAEFTPRPVKQAGAQGEEAGRRLANGDARQRRRRGKMHMRRAYRVSSWLWYDGWWDYEGDVIRTDVERVERYCKWTCIYWTNTNDLRFQAITSHTILCHYSSPIVINN